MSQLATRDHDRLEKLLEHSGPGGLGLSDRMTVDEMIHELALAFQELQRRMLGMLAEISHLRSRALRK